MKIAVDLERCVGAGKCVLVAEQIFDQRDDDGLVELIDPAPPESSMHSAEEAARLCPSGAIQIIPTNLTGTTEVRQ